MIHLNSNLPLRCPYSSTFIQHLLGLKQLCFVNVKLLPTTGGSSLNIFGTNPESELLYFKGKKEKYYSYEQKQKI